MGCGAFSSNVNIKYQIRNYKFISQTKLHYKEMSEKSSKEQEYNLLGSLLDDEDESFHQRHLSQKRPQASSAPPVFFDLGFKISETFLQNQDFDSPDPQDLSIKEAFTKKQSLQFQKSDHAFQTSYRKMSCDVQLSNYYNQNSSFQDYHYFSCMPVMSPQQELFSNISLIVEWAKDQNGSRTVQNIFQNQADDKKDIIFKAIIKDALGLIKDRFGNYVFQKIFEKGLKTHQQELLNILWGNIYELSLHAYGCRVIQKQIQYISGSKQIQIHFMGELLKAPLELIHNQNGNHVIQKCLQTFEHPLIEPIADILIENFQNLAFHCYGCRVLQKYLECHRKETKCQYILNKLLELAIPLSQCQYGNYVMQHIVTKCLEERKKIFEDIIINIFELSTNKYASNVVQKVIQSEGGEFCERLADYFIDHNQNKFLMLAKHQFGNYVIQSMINKTSEEKKNYLRKILKQNTSEISKSQYGRHVLLQLEKMHRKTK